jgi:hypothetical protein
MYHTNLEWDRFQVAMKDTPKVFKPALVKLASIAIFELLGMTTWGVGSINVQAKVKCDEDLVVVIRRIQVKYVKALKGT